MSIKFKSKEDFYSTTNQQLINIITGEDVGLKFNLKELLEKRGMTGTRLSQITGIRHGSISAYVNNSKKASLNMEHILAICIALRITDINELISLDIPAATRKRWEKDADKWDQSNWSPTYKAKSL